jgi:hypothetical protein
MIPAYLKARKANGANRLRSYAGRSTRDVRRDRWKARSRPSRQHRRRPDNESRGGDGAALRQPGEAARPRGERVDGRASAGGQLEHDSGPAQRDLRQRRIERSSFLRRAGGNLTLRPILMRSARPERLGPPALLVSPAGRAGPAIFA